MIKVGVGYSLSSSWERGAEEAARMAMHRARIRRADLALVFCTLSHHDGFRGVLRQVRSATLADQLVGCSGLGILTQECEVELEPGIAVMVLASNQVTLSPVHFQNIQERSEVFGGNLGELCGGQPLKNPLVLLFADTFCFDPPSFFRSLRASGNVPVIGAGASEDGTRSHTFQFFNEEVMEGSVVGAIFSGQFRHRVGITQACHPVGQAMIVTQAEQSRILELGGRKASELLQETFEGLEEKLRAAGGRIFLAYPSNPGETRLARGKYLVRNITGIDPEGAISVSEEIPEGQVVYFCLRDARRSKEDLQKMLAELQEAEKGEPPIFGLYFNCCGRGSSLYENSDVDVKAIRKTLGDFPLVGFASYAEFAPIGLENRYHNYSGVLTLFWKEAPL